jgi:hypothetical protein
MVDHIRLIHRHFASGGQKPFREKVSGLPKAFHWEGLNTLFSFVLRLYVHEQVDRDGGKYEYGGKG